MVATAFLSMWISNTATTMMMVPIAMAIITKLRQESSRTSSSPLAIGLLLGIAYAASIGGLATLIGTPPNLAFDKIFTTTFPNAPEITFADWILFGLPCSIVFLVIAWRVLLLVFVRGKATSSPDVASFRHEYRHLGKMSYE